MKKILSFLLVIVTVFQSQAQSYQPSYGTVMTKPVGISIAAPTDARSYFYSTTGFNFRMYNSTAEILTWLNNPTKRSGHIIYYVNVGGRAVPYWFNGGYEDSNLEPFFKPINDALLGKENVINPGTTGQYYSWDKTWRPLNATAVGLGNVLNVDQTNANNITSGSIKVPNGGTGLTSLGTASQLLRVNAAATGLEYFTLPNYLLANQPITFSGDVTGTGSTNVNLTISNNAVSFAKFQNVPTQTLLGRYSANTGLLQSITLGSGLSLNSSGVLSSSGGFTEEQIIAILEANTQEVKGKNGILFDPADTSLTFVPGNIVGNLPIASMPIQGVSGTFTNINATVQNGLITSATNGSGGGGSGVTSYNTRTGAVTSQKSDYSTWFVDLTGTYANPSWITNLAWGKITKTGSSLADLETRSASDLTGTLPDARLSSNVATLTGTQTLTNKTISNPKIVIPGAVPGDLFYVNANNELVRVGGSTAEGAYVRRVGGNPTWVDVGEPTLSTGQTSLTGFSTNPGVASTSQSSTVGGINLTANMTATLSPVDGFEFSSNGTTWVTTPITITQVGGTGSGTLYVRLSTSATLGTRSGTITITSTGATSKTISLSGEVIALASVINTTVSSLSGFTTTEGTASSSQSFTASGSSLAGNITGTLTVSDGFEVSLNNSTWQTTPLTITQSGGTASSLVYARLAATAGEGSRAGTITFSSSGAANKVVTLSGTVTVPEPPDDANTIQINMYDTGPAGGIYSNAAWNNFSTIGGNYTSGNLNYANGVASGITMNLEGANAYVANGTTYGDGNTTGFPPEVFRTTMFNNNLTSMNVIFDNCGTSTYKVQILCSRETATNYAQKFTYAGVDYNVTPTNNLSVIVEISNLTPVGGKITIPFSRVTGTFIFITAVKLIKITP